MTDPLGLIGSSGALNGAGFQPKTPGADAAGGPSFKDVLMKNIEQVNQLQAEAESAIQDLAAGNRNDFSSVMLAQKKSEEAFKALMQVRNKLMDAYDEIKQLRV